MKHKQNHLRHQKHITAALKQELVGAVEFFDACTIAFYTAMLSILASVGIYAFAFYCI